MRRLALVAVTLLACVSGAPAADAETVDQPQDVGNEVFPGHDLVNVRYTNRTGSLSVVARTGRLHTSDQLGVDLVARGSRDFDFFVSVKFSHGEPVAVVYPWTPTGLDFGHPTCTARARYDMRRDAIRVRAQDPCFPGADLSSVRLSTDLGVRGKNNASDLTASVRVRRD
ncbi:hypothetical protein G5V58_06760 [Nocardioides anomalus]|uniref:Uncharacterized protein n=1 Tax=Nocardioides anomalus TaxID=2712223 RepID=A0A6G6WBI6_9ACTN|nr:hypothetical protein [Nocardioides anomalus]QIG42513.1 hypothetical protein G5V58_06760 [Nocardioides anomalus]